MNNIENAINELKKDFKIYSDENTLIIHSTGSIDSLKSKPDIVLYPENKYDVQKIVRIAKKYKIPLIVRGGGSSPTGAVVPLNKGIVINMKRMNKVTVSIENGYVFCEPGITLKELNEILKKYNFFFPPDPSSISVATVGGAVAENSGGMRCARYGTVKDWVLKVEVILANGEITYFGEETYKNRAGYNILDLIIGSEGTLCIVTKAWLKIMPLPKKIVRIAAFFNKIDDAALAILNIRENGINPLILEYADKYGIEAANKIRNFNYPVAKGGLVITDIDSYSNECNMDDLLKSVYKIFENNHAIYIIDTDSEKEINNIMEVRRIAFTSPGILYKNFIDGDIVVPLSNIEELLIRLNKLRTKYKNVFLSICGHAGDGNLHPQIGYEEKYRNDALNEVLEINRIAIDLNGTISGEHGIGKIKNELLLEQFHKRNMDINYKFMKNIKKLFDPDDILNPGNFGL